MNFFLHKRFSIVDLLMSTAFVLGFATLWDGRIQAGLIMMAVGLVGGVVVEAAHINSR